MGKNQNRFQRLLAFTSIDLASGLTQIPVAAEEDKQNMALRDCDGNIWEFNYCGFGLTAVPPAFAGYVCDKLMLAERESVKQ